MKLQRLIYISALVRFGLASVCGRLVQFLWKECDCTTN